MLRQKFAAVALFLLAGAGSAYALSRDALWSVTQACLTGYRMTGLPFPCLTVNISHGVEQGYAIVQLPFGDRDTVLMPTRRISGIEDPFLTSDRAPNYIAMAWAERSRLAQVTPRALEQHDIGLAINSRQTRSQDQLHIHIACIAGAVRPAMAKLASQLAPHAWTKMRSALRAQQYWAYRLSADDLINDNPFRFVAELQPEIAARRDSMTMAVLGIGSAERPGFVILAAATHPERRGARSSAEALLDHTCRT